MAYLCELLRAWRSQPGGWYRLHLRWWAKLECAPCSLHQRALFRIRPTSDNDISLWALTADNSILRISLDSASRVGLYRLPAHSNQWQYLGTVNGSSAFLYASSSGGGVIWLYAGGTYLAHLSGNIGGHLASLPSVLLSTASYP